jgi:copper chaperone
MIELTLPSMTCGHCVRTVTETVHKVDAQAVVDVDLATRRVRVESRRSQDDFKKALAEEGYEAA